MVITLAEIDELELAIEDEVDSDELELLELDNELLELDSDKLELLLIKASDDVLDEIVELDSEDEIDSDEDAISDDETSDELVVEIADDELLIDDEMAAVEFDELTTEEAALLEPDVLLPPPPQAIRLQPRIPMIIGFIEEIIIKLSCVIVMVDYTISDWGLYTSNCKELNCAK